MALEQFHEVMVLARLARPLMVQRELRRADFLRCDYSWGIGDQKRDSMSPFW